MAECDQPHVGSALPIDIALPSPELMTTAHHASLTSPKNPPLNSANASDSLGYRGSIPLTVIDTGVSIPGATGDRSSCYLHGSAVASVIRHIAPSARIHSIRHSADEKRKEGTIASLSNAIHRAIADTLSTVDKEYPLAGIINISMVACESSIELHQAIQAADAAGILVIASTGNTGQCEEGSTPYPAAYPEVIAVGAVEPRHVLGPSPQAGHGELDPGRTAAPYSASNFWVDIFAPGGPVSATIEDESGHIKTIVGNPSPFIGTSFATPIVSASAALLSEIRPYATAEEIRQILIDTADQGGSYTLSERESSQEHPLKVLNPKAAIESAINAPTSDFAQPHQAVLHVSAQPVYKEQQDFSLALLLSLLLGCVLIIAIIAYAPQHSRRKRQDKSIP